MHLTVTTLLLCCQVIVSVLKTSLLKIHSQLWLLSPLSNATRILGYLQAQGL